MKTRAWAQMTGGIVLLLSGVAHGFGWLQLRLELGAATVPADVTGALAAGWYFGSVAMLAFGLIVVNQAWRRLHGEVVSRWPSLVIGVSYLVYGLAAFVARDFNPFFLLFIVTGLLVGMPALSTVATSRSSRDP